MALSGSFRRFWLCLALLLPPAAQAGPTIVPDTSNSRPVIEYTLRHGLLRVQAFTPLLRIYADGRVRVNIPEYMKRAGKYEMNIGEQGLRDLLSTLDSKGLMVHNSEGARFERQQAEAALNDLYAISDHTLSYVTIRLARYKPNRELGGPLKRNLSKRIAWNNLEQDAKKFRGFVRAQLTHEGVQALRDLLSHPDLQRVP